MDTSSGSAQAYPSTPGMYNLTTQVDGQTVYYTLRIPAGYDGHTALPVILCLHFGGTAERVVWRPLSEPDSHPRSN